MDQTVPLSAVNPSASAPALKVVMRRATDLVPYVKNARTHSDAQIEVLVKSLKEFGFNNPVLIDGQANIIAGHGRLKAAQKLGMAEVPCIVLDHMTDAQRRAYVLADNQTALLAGWDDELLALELGDLNEMGFDLSSIGFDTDELDSLLDPGTTVGRTDADDVPALPTIPVARVGDVWILGRHRLVCGDSTDASAHRAAMGGADAEVILTDPPYCSGGFQESGRVIGSPIGGNPGGGKQRPTISRDNLTTDGLEALITSVIRNVESSGCCYAFCDWRHFGTIRKAIEPLGYQFRALLIWDKETPGMGGPWRHQYEMIFFGTRRKESPTGKSGDVLSFKRSGNDHHPTQKPVELIKKIIENTVGDHIVDPFVGSGTTIIAAEMAGRVCHAIELNPAYIDVAIQRWQAFTGRIAVLDAGQRTFDAVKAERVEGYNARDDLSKSIDVAYEAVRERQEAGGPGYVPPTADAPKRRGRPPKAVAAE